MNKCEVCSKPSETLCQRCRTPYCSRTCQAEDWPVHKATCLPMPPLVAATKSELPKPKQQADVSVTSVSLRFKKYQEANDSHKPKQEPDVPPLRPPRSKLPREIVSPPLNTNDSSPSFGNPFKRNSQNIGFNANDVHNRAPPPRPEAQSSTGESNRAETIPAKEIVNETLPSAAKMQSGNEIEKAGANSQPLPQLQNLSLAEEEKEVAKTEHKQENEEAETIFTMNEIEIVPLTVDKKIVCLDVSNINRGYISTCVNDKKAVAYIDRLNTKIGEYCSRINDCYRPKTDELCLCLFDEDNEWYRGVVVEVIDSDTFQIDFIDFGIATTAHIKNIRRMPRQFLYHSLANKCFIKGFDDASAETKLKIEKFVSAHTILPVAKMELMSPGVYTIELNC